jgi:hypothetical protein
MAETTVSYSTADVEIDVPKFLADKPKGKRLKPEERTIIAEMALDAMAQGASLLMVSEKLGLAISRVFDWIHNDDDLRRRYELQKTARARVLIEMALAEVQGNHNEKTIRIADVRARHYVKIAALLNPSEFSDKTHTNLAKNGLAKSQAVSITMHFGKGEEPRGELTVVAQPEDGELP